MEIILAVIIATGVVIGFNQHESKKIENYLVKHELKANSENASELSNQILTTNLKSKEAL